MLFLVVRRQDKGEVMRSILNEAGVHGEAHTMLFSLSVNEAAGLRANESAEERVFQTSGFVMRGSPQRVFA